MMQIPSYVNPYMQQPQIQPMAQQPAPSTPSYNAVKIDVHNPSVNAGGMTQQPQYATPTMPLYNYPQAPMYQYPQAQQPAYYPPVQPVVVPPVVTQTPADVKPAEVPAPQVVAQQPTEAPKAEAPKAEEAPKTAEAPKVEVAPSAPLEPQVDLNGFVAKLTNPDYDVQAAAMEDMANMVKNDPQKATELLDVKVMDALTNIVKADTSKLTGPTAEQLAAREKLLSNQKMTDDEKKLASTITPLEQAERNKSYAMFTSAIMQKLYADEVAKLTNTTVPITELPGAVTIVEQLKNNPNPMVRTSALEALSYIQNPAYKKDLETLFTIAKNDQDKGVQEAATAALDKLSKLPEAEAPKAEAPVAEAPKADAQAAKEPEKKAA